MAVPVTGALLLVVGVWLFFFSPNLLYAAAIVSIPFSATVVANIGSGDSAKGVAAWMFFGLLWIVREAISRVSPWHRRGWFSTRGSRYGLLAFLGAVFASLSVPLLLNGTAWVPYPNPLTMSIVPVPLRFSSYNITQTMYLAFGVLVAILAAAENCTLPRLFRTLRLYVGSCVFVAGWGLLQFWCNVTGHTYPAFIFNTSMDISALGYRETLAPTGLNLTRVASVALEPSVLAEELLIALVVLLVCRGLRKPLLSKNWDAVALAAILAALLVTTSTTAYAGILVAFLIAGIALARAGKPSKIYFVAAGVGVGAAAAVVTLVPLFHHLATSVIFGKLQTSSGLVRMESIRLAAQDFVRYPVLGAGWHSVTCWDLFFLILANMGLVGLLAFASFLLPVLRRLWASTAKDSPAAVILLPTVTLVMILSEAAGLTYSAGYVWLILGLGASAGAAAAGQQGLGPRSANT